MFKIRIVESKKKIINEELSWEELKNTLKSLGANRVLDKAVANMEEREKEELANNISQAVEGVSDKIKDEELPGAEKDKERDLKHRYDYAIKAIEGGDGTEELVDLVSKTREFVEKVDHIVSPQQKATPDEGPDTFPHPLNPGQKLNKLDYWLTTIAIPKVTGVRVPRIGNLKNHNPFKNPPADTAIEKLVDTLSASLNEGPGDRREDDESDDGKEKRKEKPKSAGSVLQMLQQADPGNKGLHKVYRWLTDTLVSTMREKAYALSKRIQNLNKSGQTDIEYVEPWRSPTVTEELGGNAYIDEKFKSELQFVTDYVASKLAVAINQGKLDYRQLLGVEEPGEDPAGEDPGAEPGAEPGEEQPPGEEKSDKPINVVKGKHSLQVQLTNKFGSNNKGANKFLAAIARDIKGQLATNDINVQESLMVIHYYLLKEVFSKNKLLLNEATATELIQQYSEMDKDLDKIAGQIESQGGIEAGQAGKWLETEANKLMIKMEKLQDEISSAKKTEEEERAAAELKAQHQKRMEKAKVALDKKNQMKKYKAGKAAEKEKVDYMKTSMKPTEATKGLVNIGKTVGQKLKAAMMAINDPEQRKEFEKLVDKEKLLKAVRKFVDYAIKASGKQDQVKMVGEEKDRRSLKTILENKKPTSYKIKIIKANA